MGIGGLYLQPTAALPAPGTPLSFTVTAISAATLVSHTVTVSFAMPVVDAVTLEANPAQVAATACGSATTMLTLGNVGNMPETITLTAAPAAD
jgi:hypothetical protein